MSEFVSICPRCRQRILCDTAYVGQRIACPLCLQEIAMPAPEAHSPASPTPAPTAPMATKGGQRTPGVWIIAGVAIIAAGGLIAVASWRIRATSTASTIEPATPVVAAPVDAAKPVATPTAAATSTMSGHVISWNLDTYGTVNGSSVNYNGTAGVVPVANWNNSYPDDPKALLDDGGNHTSLNLEYGSCNTFHIQDRHPGPDADGTYNKELLNGYLNGGPAERALAITNSFVKLTDIPYPVYDVYVYLSSDVPGRQGNVTDGTTLYDFSSMGSASINGANALFRQSADKTGRYPRANYVIFQGETSRSLTITVNAMSNDQWLGIAGFQVVNRRQP